MALNYTSYVSELANMVPISSGDANFATVLPAVIDYAEQRIYRELDVLRAQVTDATTATSSNNRNFTLPTAFGTYITVDQLHAMTPAGATSTSGTRSPLTCVSPDFIDTVYPSNTSFPGVPKYYAMRSDTMVILGPPPDAAYTMEVIGIQRPAALSAANSSTFLTQYVPDLFFAASMIFISGYMRNFGAQADNPQMGASWESQYATLFKSAATEQARAKFESEAWTSNQPSPTATPPRV